MPVDAALRAHSEALVREHMESENQGPGPLSHSPDSSSSASLQLSGGTWR